MNTKDPHRWQWDDRIQYAKRCYDKNYLWTIPLETFGSSLSSPHPNCSVSWTQETCMTIWLNFENKMIMLEETLKPEKKKNTLDIDWFLFWTRQITQNILHPSNYWTVMTKGTIFEGFLWGMLPFYLAYQPHSPSGEKKQSWELLPNLVKSCVIIRWQTKPPLFDCKMWSLPLYTAFLDNGLV